MTTNSQLSTTEPKKNKNELNKQLEQEQNHRNDWVWMQNEGRSEGSTKWNNKKYTGDQKWREGLDRTEGENKHSIGTEWINKNSKKWGEA